VRWAENLNHLHVPIVLQSGTIFLEPSGLVQACNGIALSLPLYLGIPEDGSLFAETCRRVHFRVCHLNA
jgi:hypothetical protein